jgi:hypothetical protein
MEFKGVDNTDHVSPLLPTGGEGVSGPSKRIAIAVSSGPTTPAIDMQKRATETNQVELLASTPHVQRDAFPHETRQIGVELQLFGKRKLEREDVTLLQNLEEMTVSPHLKRLANQ